MTNQSGIEELYGCLTNQSNEILDWCITYVCLTIRISH